MALTYERVLSMTFRTTNAALLTLSIGVALVSTISVAQAAPLSVTYNQSRVVSLSEPASTFAVGNPSIIDANLLSPTKVLVLGKSYGVTNLIALNADGKVILNTSLHVVTDQRNRVSLYKGPSKQSYDCYGDCVPTLDLGDDLALVDPRVKITGAAQNLAKDSAGSEK